MTEGVWEPVPATSHRGYLQKGAWTRVSTGRGIELRVGARRLREIAGRLHGVWSRGEDLIPGNEIAPSHPPTSSLPCPSSRFSIHTTTPPMPTTPTRTLWMFNFWTTSSVVSLSGLRRRGHRRRGDDGFDVTVAGSAFVCQERGAHLVLSFCISIFF